MPRQKIDTELIDKTEIEIEKVPQAELNEREEGVPHHKVKLDYGEVQIDRLKDEIFKGFERLNEQFKEIGDECDALEAQYNDEMDDEARLEFNLGVSVTQVKVDSGARLSLQAFLESDPKFTITARPQTAKADKWDVTTNRQSDYLDYKLDEDIDIERPLRKTLHQAWLYPVGLIKVPYEHARKKRKREEHYSGKPELGEDGETVRYPGVESFLKQYPDAVTERNEGHWALKDLLEGKDVTFKSEFMAVTYDDPRPSFVDIRDFRVDKKTEGYEGLCESQLHIEIQAYDWWELKGMEANGDFENVNKCKVIRQDAAEKTNEEGSEFKNESTEIDANYRTRPYQVIECTYWFNEDRDSSDDDEDNPEGEKRIVCWFEVFSKTFLGGNYYPYDGVDCYYVPFYTENKVAGFYKGRFAKKLTNSHLTQNVLLNFMLTESWQQLMTTPIVKQGSPIVDQFTNKRWKPGVPLEIPIGTMDLKSELSFLDKPQRVVAAQLMPVLLFLARLDDDKTGMSAGLSGKESPVDPQAPAAKTAMLLQQSGINIKDYINCLLPSFNLIGEIVLQLTYQMSKEGRPFRQRAKAGKVTGSENVFSNISRDEMIAKTNIQSRAAGFAFDKINEKRENLTFYQLARQDPIFAQNPEGIYTLARTLAQSWSPLWKNKIDQILPTPQEFQEKQFQIAVQALGLYLKAMKDKAQVTGVPAEPDFQEFMGMATQMMAQAVTPPEESKK